MKELDDLKKWVVSIKGDEALLTVIKIAAMVLVGGFTGFFIREYNLEGPNGVKIWHWLVWLVFIALGLAIEYRKSKRDRNFPVTLISHLTAAQDLNALNTIVQRNNIVNAYLVDVISRLNGQTCALSLADQETFCTNEKSPFNLYKLKFNRKERDFLTAEGLDKLESYQFSTLPGQPPNPSKREIKNIISFLGALTDATSPVFKSSPTSLR